MKKVFAVIVTFNRPDRLESCIASLLQQQESGLTRIHVVVNSPDQQTIDVIKAFGRESLITFERHDNPGPAGGFFYGLKRFLAEDADYAWLMDDDITVHQNCLQNLMQFSDEHDYMIPRVNKENGEEVISYGWWAVLIKRSLVVAAGLPKPEFFFWAEDTEYLQRRLVYQQGVKLFRCKEAVVSHLHQRNNKRPSWYYYYVMRNTVYYRLFITGYSWKRMNRTIYFFLQSLVWIVFREQNKIKKLKLLIRGLRHGFQGRTGKLVDPAINK